VLSGTVGMLVATLWWWWQSSSSAIVKQPQHPDLRRLGQVPSRSHIQLLSHRARQERPR
jgi:hypothetical protein